MAFNSTRNRLLIAAAGASCMLVLATSHAHAEELGTKGNVVFNVERIFGFYVDKQSVDRGPVSVNTTTTDFSLLWNRAPSPFTLPRVGIDYFIDDHLTIGGNLGVFTLSSDTGRANVDATGILFGARVGYALRLSHGVSFWPRGGLSYSTISGSLGPDQHLFSLGLEGMFSLAPSENWSFLVGPTVDIGFVGKQAGNDLTENCFGIMMGFLGWLGT